MDFELALKAESRRKMTKSAGTPMFLQESLLYREAASFSSQVMRYFDEFDKENIMVILFDDFKAETESVYYAVCKFLEIDQTVSVDFGTENKNKKIIKPDVQKFLMRPPRVAKKLASIIPIKIRKKLLAGMYRHTMSYEPRPQMPPVLWGKLVNDFRPDVEALGKIIG